MGNSKVVGGIIVGIAIIAIIAVYSLNQDNADESSVTIIENVPQDSSVTNATNNQNYIVDEEGNKKYVLSADDSPILGD